MLRVQQLSKSFGTRVLFEDVSFLMNPGERLGLVGRNGHGKTTLFKILLGEQTADSGEIILPRGYRISHLSQHLSFHEPTVLAEVCTSLPASDDGTDRTYKAEAALFGLGFSKEQIEQAPQRLSGGFQVRLNLAKVLVSEPNLLLLDEPTNYLDIVSMRWLGRFLREWKNELMLITHDRGFMDGVTTHTAAIHRGKLRKVEGNTFKMFAQIEQEEEIHEKTRVNQDRERKVQERFIERFRAKASKAKAVQSRVKMLAKQDTLDQLEELKDLSFRFSLAPFPAKVVAEVEGLEFGYDPTTPLIRGLDLAVGAQDRLAVIGRNGKGKSTLLSLLVGNLSPSGGRLRFHPSTKVAYYGQENVDRLDPNRTVEEEILAVHPDHSRGAARNICGLMMFEGEQALKKISVLSGGERSRVLLGKLLVSPANLLLLDEPTNHLDLSASEGLTDALADFEGAVVLVTHSESLLRRVANRLVVFDNEQVRVFEGSYDEFLEQVGWSGEDGLRTKSTGNVAARGAQRRDLRRQRAEIIGERSKKLRPVQVKIDALESKIMELEEETRQVDAELCTAASEKRQDAIAALGRRSGELRAEVARRYEELDRLGEEQAELQSAFDARLAELEDA
ncbi:MAG: ATP-binding cassette domain-containing protein [Planctomycetota bacterium]